MSRKKKGNYYRDDYWQSAGYNQQLFTIYRAQLMALALARFKWVNLPETCDALYLERTLLTEGYATIAKPKNKPYFYSTKAVLSGYQSVYEQPTSWRSIGVNGWSFNVTPANGCLVYDNLVGTPTIVQLNHYARELTDITRTTQVNRANQKTPYIITAPQTKKLDVINLVKQIFGGEPAVLGLNSFTDIDVSVLNLEVEYLEPQLQEAFLNVWQQAYTALGIPYMPFKSERQIEDEVHSVTAPATLLSLNPLEARRYGLKKLNARHECFFDKPIEVVWNYDIVTNNYNAEHDMTIGSEDNDIERV